MGLGERLARLLGRARPDDDPTAVLDASLAEQTAVLQDSRRGVADVVTSRKRIELQLRRLTEQAGQLEQQAQAAVDGGDDDTARSLLSRRAGLLAQADALEPDAARLRDQEQRLQEQLQHLEGRVEAFRAQRETLRASETAAGAHLRVVEAQAGLTAESADVGLALQQARERTEALQARADAAEELAGSGPLALPGESDGDAAERRLAALQADGDPVEAELDRLRTRRP